eukprot:jgi/Tetstr1/441094/TSEL_029362.t1
MDELQAGKCTGGPGLAARLEKYEEGLARIAREGLQPSLTFGETRKLHLMHLRIESMACYLVDSRPSIRADPQRRDKDRDKLERFTGAVPGEQCPPTVRLLLEPLLPLLRDA